VQVEAKQNRIWTQAMPRWSSNNNTVRGVYRLCGLEVLTPWKYVGGVRVSFDPLKCHIFFIQNCCWITLQVSHRQGWKTLSKMENKTNFSRLLKQFDGLTWLTLRAWPPYFTTDLRNWQHKSYVQSVRDSSILVTLLLPVPIRSHL